MARILALDFGGLTRALLLISCVTLSKLLNFSVSLSLVIMEDKNSLYFIGLMRVDAQ